MVLANLIRGSGARTGVIHIARDAEGMEATRQLLTFFAPEIEVRMFPAWDCMPYDRVSPSPTVLSQRMETLGALAERPDGSEAMVMLTTINAGATADPATCVGFGRKPYR